MNTNDYSLELWIDGNNSTGSSWTSLAPATHSLQRVGGMSAPTVRNSRFNFHRELFFGNNERSKLRTSANYAIQSGRAYYAFVVSENTESGERTLLAFNATNTEADARRSTLQWNGNNVRVGWSGTLNAFNPANTQNFGIASMNLVNGGASTMSINGRNFSFTAGTQTSNVRLLIGNGSQDDSGLARGNRLPFNGSIQEIIVMSGNERMPETDIQKIHSYLAIKYGLTLNNINAHLLNSDGAIVWNRDRNPGHDHHVFGIARDDATLLNQVQSRHSDSHVLTLFRGNRVEALNSDNSSIAGFTADKTYVILGSDGGNINEDVPDIYFEESTAFINATTDTKINFRARIVYRAQVTVAGKPSAQTVNMQIQNSRVNYLLVSTSSWISPTQTRIYPIVNGVAMRVVLNDGDYISFAGFETTPGGVAGHTLNLWIDGNNSTNSSWGNLANSTHSLERFATHAPLVRNSRFNFHRELFFDHQVGSKLRTTENYLIQSGQAYHAFVVSDNHRSGEQTLIAFNPGNSDANARRTSLQWSTTGNNIRVGWNGTMHIRNNTRNYGIASMSVLNGGGANAGIVHKNGVSSSFNPASHSVNNRLQIGNGNNDSSTGSNLPFRGSIQEVIVMSGSERMSDIDIQKIHSYLAIKYGIHLEAGDYIASNGKTVWSRSENDGFNNHIFGIGRDDFSKLNQKQARAASSSYLTVFLGERLAALNNENTATINDMQFLMIGSNGLPGINRLSTIIKSGDQYENDAIVAFQNIDLQSAVYKAQLTGMNSINVKTMVASSFLYALVSTDSNFEPTNTRIYPVTGDVIEIELTDKYRYFKFVGYSPRLRETSGLVMWLRADDPVSLGLIPLAPNDGSISGHPTPLAHPDNIQGVQSWRDVLRGHTYTNAQANRMPIYEAHNPEMNFQPAIRFWTSGTATGSPSAHLNSANGIFPANDGHTAFFVLNTGYHQNTGNAMVFPMHFGVDLSGDNFDPNHGPIYGLRRSGANNPNTINAGGTFRQMNTIAAPGALATNANATIISGYVPTRTNAGGRNGWIEFRLNGGSNSLNSANTVPAFNTAQFSRLGSGVNSQHTVRGLMSEVIFFDKVLTPAEITQVETYLAFKYGVTLRSPNIGRFNYTLSNGNIVWEGEIDNAASSYVRFYNNIAAVVRDDAARLNLRHSHSTDIGSILYMGVPNLANITETRLTDCGSHLGLLDNNQEAIVWGSNTATGFVRMDADACGDFDERFERIWYVRKHTQNDRSLPMLVSARDNRNARFGIGTNVEHYYNLMDENNDFFLIVANSLEDMESGNFKAVIPMNWLEGNHQVLYTFTENETYITFGYRTNERGCVGNPDISFTGTKRFLWTQWTSGTNRTASSNTSFTHLTPPVYLGDGISVDSTRVRYQGGTYSSTQPGVRATRGWPRSVNAPERGSLEVRRRGGLPGNPQSDVIITVGFNNPVVPEFTISALDGNRRSWEEVEIIGRCAGSDVIFYPTLSYVSSPSASSYVITDNKATVRRRGPMSPGNRNGRVHVEFDGGVTYIEIRYRTVGQRSRLRQRINISPITLRDVQPLPPVNEDRLSFVKRVRETDVSTCERVEYTLLIQNTNCEGKFVDFTDTLPEFMMWESFVLDTTNTLHNSQIQINNYEGNRVIEVNSLFLPGTSTIRLTATAVFDENAPTADYKNRAVVSYNRISGTAGNEVISRQMLESVVVIHAQEGQRKEPVEMTVTASSPYYKENLEIEFTATIINPNEEIIDSYLDFMFNEGFTFVPGSFRVTDGNDNVITGNLILVPFEDADDPFFTIAGIGFDASELGNEETVEGFTLPAGTTIIRFKLLAPAVAERELDDAGNETDRKVPLELEYSFFSAMDDPCFIRSVEGLEGVKIVPYFSNVHIITNRHIVPRFRRQL